ncbi:MAG TPA: macro domain-containing protein [Anaerolineaceae bacterium]|nr:macro domain-containing protein [Anaerolineaceae bacterium]
MSIIELTYTYPSGQRLEVLQGDITDEAVDVIVNAANSRLLHGSGIAGAVARKGGDVVIRESAEWVRKHGPVTHGNPAYTRAGNLPCRYVIHAVGPVFGEGEEEDKLYRAISGSLARADELKAASIAIPALSTGVFNFPVESAAGVFYAALRSYFLAHPDSSVQLVRFVLWDERTLQVFMQAADF